MRLVPATAGGRAAVGVALLLTAATAWLWAHEGHAPLPARGVVVDVAKGRITITKEVREALDVRSAAILSQPLPEKLLAHATVVAPWQAHAFATSRLPGRIVALPVKPGQHVEAGQVLAEVRSIELESLQVDLLNAKAEADLAGKILQELERSTSAVPAQQVLEARARVRQSAIALDIARG